MSQAGVAGALADRGGRAPHPKTPTEALRLLQAGNKRYRQGKLQLRDYSPVGERRAAEQKPFAAIVTCADSRISPELVFDLERGNLFVSRIAGNSIDTGTLGSSEYAVAATSIADFTAPQSLWPSTTISFTPRTHLKENPAMPAQLEYVDPNRPPGLFSRVYAALANTRLGRFMSANFVWKVDPYLMRATRGRVGMGLVLPTALLETRGAKSGAVRRNGVIYFHDGDRVTIVASKLGYDHDPAWFHNLQAHPDVTLGGVPMRATVVDDEAERRRLWALADRVFAPYAAYRREAAKANRTIPIVQLTPREPGVAV